MACFIGLWRQYQVGKEEAIEHLGGEAVHAPTKPSTIHRPELSERKTSEPVEEMQRMEKEEASVPANHQFPSFLEAGLVPQTTHEGEEAPLLMKEGHEESLWERVPGPHKMEYKIKKHPIGSDVAFEQQHPPPAPDIKALLKRQMVRKKPVTKFPLIASATATSGGIPPMTTSTVRGQVFEHHHANPAKHTLAGQISHHPLSLARRQALKHQQHHRAPPTATKPSAASSTVDNTAQVQPQGGEKTSFQTTQPPIPPPLPAKDWVSSRTRLQQQQQQQQRIHKKKEASIPPSPSFIPNPPSSSSPTYAGIPTSPPHPHAVAVAPATDYEIDVMPPNLRHPHGRMDTAEPQPVRPTSSSTSNTVTGETSKMDMRFQLDVLKMRLVAAQKSRDEVVMRWATHEALRDRNLTLLDQVRGDEMKHQDELIERSKVRDGVVRLEQEAKQKVDELHAQLMRIERDRAECEARCIGEQQMCSELERRIKDHTTGINHAMALKQKRELEVKDLELKVELLELEMKRADIFQGDEPPLYHPDYTTRVEIPSDTWTRIRSPGGGEQTTPTGGAPTSFGPNRPVVSSQSTVAKESPPSKEELMNSAERHALPIQRQLPTKYTTPTKRSHAPPPSTSTVVPTEVSAPTKSHLPVQPPVQPPVQSPIQPPSLPTQVAIPPPQSSVLPSAPASAPSDIRFSVPEYDTLPLKSYTRPPPPFTLPVESRHATPPLPGSSALISPQQLYLQQQQLLQHLNQQYDQHEWSQQQAGAYSPPYIPPGTSGSSFVKPLPASSSKGQPFVPIAPQRTPSDALPPPLPPRIKQPQEVKQEQTHQLSLGSGPSTYPPPYELPRESLQRPQLPPEARKGASPPSAGSIKVPISHRY